ncbi:MAG: gliding motility-associated C-terminal domain-containing protein [Cyclobacteriaceae bacterium]
MTSRQCHIVRSLTAYWLLMASYAFSQNQSNHWLFGENLKLDFNAGNPTISIEGAMNSLEGTTALSSENGDLLLYSNGENVWNGNHQEIASSNQINGSSNARQSALLLQHSDDNVTLITNGSQFSEENLGLNYHKIRRHAEFVVTSANNHLQNSAAEGMAAVEIKECVSREYWLVAGKIDDPGHIYLYRVTPDSVYFQSKMAYGGQYPVKYIKFSPNVDRLVVLEDKGDSKSSAWLIDFEPLSGQILNSREILERENVFLESAEFSSSGHLLYITLDQLYQYNVTTNNIVSTASEQPVAMQLASEDEIILLLYPGIAILDSINMVGLGTIETLDLSQEILLRFRQGLPSFPSSYFNYSLRADAGQDEQLCSRDTVIIGGSSIGQEYIWNPEIYLNNPFSANPKFSKINSSNSIDTLIYALEVRNNQLSSCDTIEVIVYPEPKLEIIGPTSICPGEENVEYYFEPVVGYNYQWKVSNGEVTILAENQISVNWPDTSGIGHVLLGIHPQNLVCEPDTSILEVRINYEIDSPIPMGDTSICTEKRSGNIYSVPTSPNAVYLWSTENGVVVSGQGNSEVTVDWKEEGLHVIHMEQTITTNDTICFGKSPELEIQFIDDSSSIDLELVTVDTMTNNSIRLSWENFTNQPNSNPIYLWRSVHDQNQFSQIKEVSPSLKESIDIEVEIDRYAYDYYISQTSWCDNEIVSSVHNSVLLSNSNVYDSEIIELSYNEYQAWISFPYSILVLHDVDELGTEKILEEFNDYRSPLQIRSFPTSFDHFFRVGAFIDSELISWSNQIKVQINPILEIPNVFTPNNDGINDTFDFRSLEFFPNNTLQLFDRSGNQLAAFTNYRGSWDGGDYPADTYFYLFKEFRTGLSYKGWVKILK